MRGGAIADPASQAKGRQVASRSVVLSLLCRIGSRQMRSGVAQDDDAITCVQAECIGLHDGKSGPVVGSHDEFRKRGRVAVTGALQVATADHSLRQESCPTGTVTFRIERMVPLRVVAG